VTNPVPADNILALVNHPTAEVDNPPNNLEEGNIYLK